MKDPIGASISNSFRIVDGEVFLESIANQFPSVRVESSVDEVGDDELMPGQTRVQLHAVDGFWPDESEDPSVLTGDLLEVVGDHLAPGELAIFHSVAYTGPNDLRVMSTSVNEQGRRRTIELAQIEALHRVAQSMGHD